MARRFRNKVMERRAREKRATKGALEEPTGWHANAWEIDWNSLRGTLHSDLDSVELQHYALKRVD